MRALRTTAFFSAVLLAALAGEGAGQVRDPSNLLAKPARLTVEDTLLQDALRALHQRSGVSIAFSPDLLPSGVRVSCSCEENTVGEALRQILRGTELTFEATRTLIRVVPPPPEGPAPGDTGSLTGTILGAGTERPVVNAMVRLSDGRGGISDEQGRFILVGIPPGEYDLRVTGLGWESVTVDGIQVGRDQATVVGVTLTPMAIPLAEMVVAPSTYGILQDPLVLSQTISREEVRAMPQLGGDIFRTMERLPGVTSNDFTARLFIRGSRADEVLTLMDGLELYEPYHLKQWDAVLSILDAETVGRVDLITGGFPAEYGNRSAGVLSLESVEPRTDRTRTSAGLSFMNLSLRNEGGFAGGKGSWLVTARRGFLDIVFKIASVDGNYHPAYYDVFGKVQYEIHPGHRLSARVLHAEDDLRGADDDDGSEHEDLYGNSYLWLTWDAEWSEKLSARTILSGSRVTKNRHGMDFGGDGSIKILDVKDRQETRFLGLKSDLSWELSPRTVLKAGLDLKPGWGSYDYFLWRDEGVPNFDDPKGPAFHERTDTTDLSLDPNGFDAGAYVANRFRLSEAATAEVGLRYQYSSLTGTGHLRPRISASYQIDPRTAIRAAWGQYTQSQGLNELLIADGDTLFHPAQEAEHRILGLEHNLFDRVNLRLEAYERLMSHPFPEYRNLVEDVEAVWEEGPGDRVAVYPDRRRAQGVEVMARGPLGNWAGWSVSYAYSKTQDRTDGAWKPRPYDQRHSTQVHLAVRPTPAWTFTGVWQARTGWPASEQTFEIATLATGDPVIGGFFPDPYGLRLPSYRRLDIRASRRFDLPKGRLFLDLDLFNALGRKNPQLLDYDLFWFNPQLRTFAYGSEVEESIPRLITLGLRWEF